MTHKRINFDDIKLINSNAESKKIEKNWNSSLTVVNKTGQNSQKVFECKSCCCGFCVNPYDGEKYCGFCGSRLKLIQINLGNAAERTTPIYVDYQDAIKLKIRIKNIGMVDIDKLWELKIY